MHGILKSKDIPNIYDLSQETQKYPEIHPSIAGIIPRVLPNISLPIPGRIPKVILDLHARVHDPLSNPFLYTTPPLVIVGALLLLAVLLCCCGIEL